MNQPSAAPPPLGGSAAAGVPAGTPVAFLGPSLALECAEAIAPGVRFLPPIRQGDLTTVLEFDKPRAVLIVDGEFGQSLSVWHKEILAAIGQGVRVVGASSMGALRAAELDRFGMEGVGAIYEYYRDAFLTADEDVALIHADADDGWRALTWPLVNIRATVAALHNGGRIGAQEAEAVLAAAQSLHFRDRVAPALAARLAELGTDDGLARELAALITTNYVDQKRADACDALAYLGAIDQHPRPDYEHTDAVAMRTLGLEFSDVVLTRPGGTVRRYQVVNDAALHLTDFTDLARRATDRYVGLELARQTSVEATAQQITEERARFLRRRGLTEDTLADWLGANDLDQARFHELMSDEARLRLIRRQIQDHRFFETNRRMVIEQLQLEGRYAEAADAAARRCKLTARSAGEPFPTTESDVVELLRRHATATPWRPEADLVTIADEQGFGGPQAFLLALTDAVAAGDEMRRQRDRVARLLGLGRTEAAPAKEPLGGRRVHAMLEGHQITHVLMTVIELGLADALLDGPRSTDNLAAATGTRPDRLERLLRLLTGIGLVRAEGDAWALTGDGFHLAVPGGLRDYAADLQAESFAIWRGLADVIRGSDPPAYPSSEAGDAAIHAAAGALGMSGPIVDVLDLMPGERVIDIGGGLGALAEEIANRHAGVAVTLVELPGTAARAAERLAALPVGSRITVEVADPSGRPMPACPDADVVVLQRILFNLDDPAAVEVLARARERLRPGGRIEVFDVVADGSALAGFCDLYNLARSGGMARDEAGWRAVAHAAGLTVNIAGKPVSPLTRLTMRPEVMS
mgnify:CR=1 FL=1